MTEWSMTCSRCHADQHRDLAHFCDRCGTSLNLPDQPEGVFPRRIGEPYEEYERRWELSQEFVGGMRR